MTKHKLMPFELQDRLNQGLLNIEDMCYVAFEDYQAVLSGSQREEYGCGKWTQFRPLKEQDKLELGLIKLGAGKGRYVAIDNIKKVEPTCFIATAVYQNSDAWQVENYRWLDRDVLMPNPLGREFSNWYHSGGGKRLADIVEEYPVLRQPCRVVLDLGARVVNYVKSKR